MRAINISFGPVTDEYSMLRNGGDLYVEVSQGNWVRFADLNAGHPAIAAVNNGSLKAGILANDGQTLTTLNAYDVGHRELMKAQGLQIHIPDKSENSPLLNNQIEQLQQRIKELLQTCDSAQIWLNFSDEIAASVIRDPHHQVLTQKIAKLKKAMQQKKKNLTLPDNDPLLPANIRTDDGTGPQQARWFKELFRANKDSRKQFMGAA